MLKLGDSGNPVGDLQQRLVESGRSIDSAELTAQQYGPSTASAVCDFQRGSSGPHGPLAVDGNVGPDTLFALEHPTDGWCVPGWIGPGTAVDPGSMVVQLAAKDIGRREDPNGSNDGPMLAKYHTLGRPWCALAVSAWWGEAPAGLPWGQPIAGTATLAEWARRRKLEVPQGVAVRPGDVFVIQRGDGHGHTGLIGAISPDGKQLYTIEGNCGNAVRGRIRGRGDVTVIFRPAGAIG